jgi:hypothetical protein
MRGEPAWPGEGTWPPGDDEEPPLPFGLNGGIMPFGIGNPGAGIPFIRGGELCI